MTSTLLAFPDMDSLVGLAVVVVWIIGWIFKVITSQNQKGPPVAGRPRPQSRARDDKLQEEIDIFIQEVGPKKPSRRPAAERSSTAAKPSRNPRSQPQQPSKSAGNRTPPRRVRPGEELATRHMAGTEKALGAGVQQHLQQHMAERVSRETAAHLKHSVDQSVADHLGQPVAGASATPAQPAAPGPGIEARRSRFAEVFRNPATLQQAIVVSLILSPPPGRKLRESR